MVHVSDQQGFFFFLVVVHETVVLLKVGISDSVLFPSKRLSQFVLKSILYHVPLNSISAEIMSFCLTLYLEYLVYHAWHTVGPDNCLLSLLSLSIQI